MAIPSLISRRNAAEILGVCPRTMKRWASVGYGPVITRVGMKVMFKEEALIDWIDSCQRPNRNRSFLDRIFTHSWLAKNTRN